MGFSVAGLRGFLHLLTSLLDVSKAFFFFFQNSLPLVVLALSPLTILKFHFVLFYKAFDFIMFFVTPTAAFSVCFYRY